MTSTIPEMMSTTQGIAPCGRAAALFLGRTGLNLAIFAMVAPGSVGAPRIRQVQAETGCFACAGLGELQLVCACRVTLECLATNSA